MTEKSWHPRVLQHEKKYRVSTRSTHKITLLGPPRQTKLPDMWTDCHHGARHGGPIRQSNTMADALENRTVCAATMDIEGALLFQHGREPYRTFSKPVENSKAAGAGDTYASALTLALASGASIEAAGEIAKCSAAVILQKSGTATCTQAELNQHFGSAQICPALQELKSR